MPTPIEVRQGGLARQIATSSNAAELVKLISHARRDMSSDAQREVDRARLIEAAQAGDAVTVKRLAWKL